MDEEIQRHLEMAARDREARGESAREATYAARREFGNATLVREFTRQMWGGAWFQDLWQDVGLGWRRLRGSPGFTLVAVLTFAFGVGVNSAVFGVANWLMLRPVPGVRDQHRLVDIEVRDTSGFLRGTSYLNLADLHRRVAALSALAGYTRAIPVAVFLDGRQPTYGRASFVSAGFFGVLGTRFALGRGFTVQEGQDASQVPTAVASHRFWRSSLGGDSGVVGRTVTLNGVRARLVGITEPGFEGPDLLGDVDFWVPGSAFSTIGHLGSTNAQTDRRSEIFGELVGRVAPGESLDRVDAQVRTAVAGLVAAHPTENVNWTKPAVFRGVGVPTESRDGVRRAVTLLGAVAGLVLLIACLNVGNLFLFRGLGRRTEWAVRQALGAPAGRLLRLQLVESSLVSAAAAVPALALCWWIAGLFSGSVLPGTPGAITPQRMPLDWRVIGVTVGIAVAAGLVSALIPMIAGLRSDQLPGLQAAPMRTASAGGRLRTTLATAQLALSLSLLVVTLLMVSSLRNLRAVDVGFDADRVSAFIVRPAWSGYTRDQGKVVMQEALAQVQAARGVEAAAWAGDAPFSATIGARVRAADATQSASWASATAAWVSPSYFRTLGIPMLAGSTFDDARTFGPMFGGGERVAILTESLARRVFGTGSAVGRTVSDELPGPPVRVIGVVADSRWASLINEGRGPLLYVPLSSYFADGAVLLVRSSMSGAPLHNLVQAAVNRVAPAVPVLDMARLRERINQSVWQDRLLARLLSVFAVLAVLLACVGLYAVIAFSVAERTRELGIRIALGAPAGRVIAMILGRGAVLGGIGVALGLGGAAALSRLVASRLYGVAALQPQVYLLAAALLLALVFVASWVPARRATQVDPLTALRL